MGPDAPDAPGPTTWAEWEHALADAAAGLAEEGSVTAFAPRADARMARTPAGSRFRWLLGARKRPMVPSVRLVRVEDHLRGHWTGSARRGGFFPWTPAEEQTLIGLGWHPPSATDGEDFLRYWPDDVPQGPYLPADDAARASAVVAATFRDVLGVDEADLPVLRRD